MNNFSKNFMLKKLYLFILFGVVVLGAQNYAWPTSASKALSSSFCEYRPGHYHSAIDIKTWNREGYPVYAVSDGRIFKIHISPFGYGKVLYLKLDDGRFAVYAHLQHFPKAIENEIRKKQIRNKRYSITWRPEKWRVKRGQIVAYSGQTGIGVPHLHFELRDPQGHPLNPLHYYPPVADHKAPRLLALRLMPQKAGSKVNRSFLPQEVGLVPLSGDTLRPDRALSAAGLIGLAIRGYDQSDKVHNKYGFYSTTLWVNGKKLFHIQYDTLDFDLTGQVDLEIDYPFYKSSKKRFHKLFVEPFNQLPFYERSLGNGLFRAGPKALPFLIKVNDFYGNATFVKGRIEPESGPKLIPEMVRQTSDGLYLELSLPNGLSALSFRQQTGHGWQPVERFEIVRQIFREKTQSMLFKLQPDSEALQIACRVELKNSDTLSTMVPLMDVLQKSKPQLALIPQGSYMVLKVQPLSFLPALKIVAIRGHLKENLAWLRTGPALEAILPTSLFEGSLPLQIRLSSNRRVLADSVLNFHVLKPGQVNSWQFVDEQALLESDSSSVYDTLLFSASQSSLNSLKIAAPVFSKPLRLWGIHKKFRHFLHLHLVADSVSARPKQVGLCRLSGNGKLSWTSARYDSIENSYSGSIVSFGTYILAADSTAPEVDIQSPLSAKLYSRMPEIKFRTIDSLAGIGSETNIKVTVDGRFVVPEWDPERNLVKAKPHWKLSPGKHHLRVLVTDAAGNTTERLRVFRIAGNQQ